ncbi:hypothetical protein Undi14_01440 [Undibacterium sp. 14-3-2]|uniref:hypothetical protein n=1 Tax=Undibacterium sp. 14-3-2 TaxID=2800129 RepID=UPI0019079A0C|nr:hypothetical protein [Undibacterium sp. 14-3-2]MBK1888680.1 hypothetical protein [Undibacterium sp. 14-3-2]
MISTTHKKYFLTFCITTLIGALIYFSFLDDTSDTLLTNNHEANSANVIPAFHQETNNIGKIKSENTCVENPKTSLMNSNEFTIIKDARKNILELKEMLKANPKELQSILNGNAPPSKSDIYTLALFEIAASCLKLSLPMEVYSINQETKYVQFTSSQCNVFPIETLSKPLSFLTKEISKGSTLAKTFYLLNALDLAPIYKKMHSAEYDAYSEEILRNAEQYGFEAAKDGAVEANYVMSRAYRLGEFGKKDISMAVSYLIPLAKHNKNQEITETFNKLNSQLSKLEQQKASDFALGCKNQKDNLILANPFN